MANEHKKFPFTLLECIETYPNGGALRTFGDTFWTQIISYHSASANGTGAKAEYLGFANPGVGISASGWAIKLITYDASGSVTGISWAEGSMAMSRKWADKATYTYS